MNNPELITKLSAAQNGIWQTVALQVGEACGESVQFNSPMILESQVVEVLQEFEEPVVIVQFAFAGHPESMQCLMVSVDTVTALHCSIADEIEVFEDTNIEAVRPALEGMIQGICMAVGNRLDEVVVASDISFRLGRFLRPTSMQPTDMMIRVQLSVGVGSTIDTLTWAMDPHTAHFVVGLAPASDPAPIAFGALPQFGSSASPQSNREESHGLDILMDIPLEITVELGRTRRIVKDVVELGVGSIVEIEKAAGEPVDILVNGRLVARGEVVVIEDNFGVRITEILNPRDRLMRLNDAA